jgi:hypothetical protein
MEPSPPEPPAEPPPPPPSSEPSPPARDSRAHFAGYLIGGFLLYGTALGCAFTSEAGLILLALVIIAAIATGLSGKARGFALGVFIGVGLTLLAIGLCFAAISKM